MSSPTRPVLPKFNYASSMIVEDHLKRMLSMTHGRFWTPYDNRLLPRAPHSVFGDFPKELLPRKCKENRVENSPTRSPTISNAITAQGSRKYFHVVKSLAILKKGMGLGGKTASLLTPLPKPSPEKPVAGALYARSVPITDFRRFYDRGDLPIMIQHG